MIRLGLRDDRGSVGSYTVLSAREAEVLCPERTNGDLIGAVQASKIMARELAGVSSDDTRYKAVSPSSGMPRVDGHLQVSLDNLTKPTPYRSRGSGSCSRQC